ncbi:EG45-like domain containing protein 2 [Sesamum alatum]|uniref:EG45-like domain containing protein 2 n=1 Tax=Sesamum alatum TaxID=300844 RepID=A0AAE2CVA2_9LAMI|nr:EG45-like domain containing protein 2 [Sesamum alatum]
MLLITRRNRVSVTHIYCSSFRVDRSNLGRQSIRDFRSPSTPEINFIIRMLKPEFLLLWFFLLLLGPELQFSTADIGTASQYLPPYTPTACYGSDLSQFPSSGLFAAASEGIWDNGAACGRQYLVKCISAAVPKTCVEGQTIQVQIVDRAVSAVSPPTRPGSSLVLSNIAFQTIAKNAVPYLNIEFQQL